MTQITEELFWEINRIGIALTSEKNIGKILDKILSECIKITASDAGSLYLHTTDNGREILRFVLAKNHSREVPFRGFTIDLDSNSIAGYVAVTRKPLNIRDVDNIPAETGLTYNANFDFSINYRTVNMLVVPMLDIRGQVVGILQLINKKKSGDLILKNPDLIPSQIVPYSNDEERIVLSLTSQAAILVERARLRDDLKQLPLSFIEALIAALDARDRISSGHSRRVASLALELAQEVHRANTSSFQDVHFDEDDIQEIYFAGLLHDIGKLGVAENILGKTNRLSLERLRTLKYKLICVKQEYRARESSLDAAARDWLNQVDGYFDVLCQLNRKAKLNETDHKWIEHFKQLTFHDGTEEEHSFFDSHEKEAFCTNGFLTPLESETIDLHVDFGYDLLKQIRWPDGLARIPDLVRNHHERLDGTGFPQKLTSDNLGIRDRILALVDEFDTLTTRKPGDDTQEHSQGQAFAALRSIANQGKHDRDLVQLFISSSILHKEEESG